LYGRVSKDDGVMDAENQLHELREFVARSGWDLTGEYVDRITGGTDQRPEFKRLFEDASKRRFDLVLFWSLADFSREGVLETLQHPKRLEGWGVGWRSYTESFFDSTGPFKDAVIAIMASLAALERQKISERTKAGLRPGSPRRSYSGPPACEGPCRRDSQASGIR
jgi:DNA invertase Pin-like site-specific DNA recombinase